MPDLIGRRVLLYTVGKWKVEVDFNGIPLLQAHVYLKSIFWLAKTNFVKHASYTRDCHYLYYCDHGLVCMV